MSWRGHSICLKASRCKAHGRFTSPGVGPAADLLRCAASTRRGLRRLKMEGWPIQIRNQHISQQQGPIWQGKGSRITRVKNSMFVKTKAGAATFAPIPNAGKAPPAVALGEVAAPQVQPLSHFGSPKRLCPPAHNLQLAGCSEHVQNPKAKKQCLGGGAGVFSTQVVDELWYCFFWCGNPNNAAKGGAGWTKSASQQLEWMKP